MSTLEAILQWNGEVHRTDAHGLGAGMTVLGGSNAWLCLPPGDITKYGGFFWFDERLQAWVKGLDVLHIPGARITRVTYSITRVERRYDNGAIESYHWDEKSLAYELKGHNGPLFLDLDMRRIDDERRTGRFYDISQTKDVVACHYTKWRDGSRTEREYDLQLTVHGGRFKRLGSWEERRYPYDTLRGDNDHLWVYRAGAFLVNGTVSLHIRAQGLAPAIDVDREEKLAPALCLSSLDCLTSELGRSKRLMAGLPWFRESWTRDELICLGALMKSRRYLLVKEILGRYLKTLAQQGTLTAHHPLGGLASADGLGWIGKRLLDLVTALQARDILDRHFNEGELRAASETLYTGLCAQPTADGLIVNGPGETWMDAPVAGDTRAGACIEIQALSLAGFAACTLLGIQGAAERESHLATLVRDRFLLNGILADRIKEGSADATARPNLFIAAYAYPSLLSREQWINAIDHALPRLWLEWGGLSSIDTQSPLFISHYQGMRNTSYHRGDSWYWINAMAALVLQRLDKHRYADAIRCLRKGCLRDLYSQGALGHCSELSSAYQQEWGGCYAQAWSAALLYELLNEPN